MEPSFPQDMPCAPSATGSALEPGARCAGGGNGHAAAVGVSLKPMSAGVRWSSGWTRRWARHLVIVQAAWLVLVCGLGGWWVWLMHSQARRIADLEQQAGMAAPAIREQSLRTERMLLWEGGAFFAALLVSLGALAILHGRDLARARALQAFFASATHELRTPLAALRLEVEGLADVVEPGHPGRPWVERMLEDSGRLEAQVERALELARIEGGGDVPVQSANLRAVVADFVRSWRPPPGRRVEVRNLTANVGAWANPASLHALLRNLFENSVRHATAEDLVITLETVESAASVGLRVSDNGGPPRGLPPALGTLFARGAGSRGAGVGLYLSRQLMRRMGGDARFEPTPAGFLAILTFQGEPAHG